jgi:hypothetical protein
MLVITVDLLPGGYAPMRRTIAAMSITNISDLAEISDYRVEARARPAIRLPALHRAPFGHARAQSVWALLAQALEEIMKADSMEL